ncbi:hypothetical protein [Absidia glauca]|uniref:3-hydroxyisobutyryl-CoA hydrolase n=1 Tax=Absidia glauca TaxID=4829 RepID=A0A168R9Q4_ABSGL|nr:hypothetical protein [Absidia glauca]
MSTNASDRLAMINLQLQQPKFSESAVICYEHDGIGELILNCPSRLNTMRMDLIAPIRDQLTKWNGKMKVLVLKSSSAGKTFSAGVDLKHMMENMSKGQHNDNLDFITVGYTLFHRMASLPRPLIAIFDGIAMGSGAGIGVHVSFRIATENTKFAMPESKIGLAPDSGLGFTFSRLDGSLGIYLGLTGFPLKGTDAFHAGIATHYVPSTRIAELEHRLASLPRPVTHDDVNDTIENVSNDSIPPPSMPSEIRRAIDRYDSVRAIFTALKEEQMSSSEPVKQWAQRTLAHLQTLCPTSLVVILAHIRRCGSLTLGQCFDHDYSLVQKLIIRPDFYHGVHTITRGSKARGSVVGWQPATIEEIEDERAIVRGFLSTPSTRPLHLVCGINTSDAPDFTEYPYRQYMLPSEHDIKDILEASTERHTSRTSGLDFILSHLNGKHGTREKVLEVLDRKTKTIDRVLKWID